MINKKLSFIYTIILGLILGSGGTYIYLTSQKNYQEQPGVTRIQSQLIYEFINPLLSYEVESSTFSEYEKLENELTDLIERNKKEHKLQDASIYFRNLTDGKWVGINETKEYAPASLYKVPIMIAYLKQAETDPTILSKKIKFDNPNSIAPPQDIPPAKKIEFGKEYSIEELIEYMIVFSDNNAANVLAERIYLDEQNSYTEMLGDLGLPITTKTISTKSYSLFLRILRNATYLNREMSEKALGILAKTEFKDGLRAGIPENIQIANKFGEHGYYENGVLIEELRDCGIIYYPDHPYLLCILAQGRDVATLKNVIREISQLVYAEINKQYE